MASPRINPAYAPIDPAHCFDGLFVPTNGSRRGRLLVPLRQFGEIQIGFQGFEQLGVDDQSILLAASAQLGVDGQAILDNPDGPVSSQLRRDLMITGKDVGVQTASKRISMRSLLIDAGYRQTESGASLARARDCLNRLRSVQVREVNPRTGWDRASNLLSTFFNVKTQEAFVAVNPRLTQAVFHGQHVRVSLFERRSLDGEVAKLLHCWMSSNVRLGQAIGNGRGVRLDTLSEHVWGTALSEAASKKVKSRRRGLIADALDEISDRTRKLPGGQGWQIDRTPSGLAYITRPKKMPGDGLLPDGRTPS